jgi:hypothetical protein
MSVPRRCPNDGRRKRHFRAALQNGSGPRSPGLLNFATGFGRDVVADFSAGAGVLDVIELDNQVFSNFASVLAATRQVGADAVITVDASNALTLKNVLVSNLHADDFMFV